ncbi:unnamed protein product, partial [Polarella glacialis]
APRDADSSEVPADGAATPSLRFADDEDRELYYLTLGRVDVPQQADSVDVASSQIAPGDPVPQSDTQEIITDSGFSYSMPRSTGLPSPEDLRQAEEDWHNHAEIRAEFYRSWNPPQYAEEIVQTDIKAGADTSPAQVAWRRHIANTTLPSSSSAGATGSPAADQDATGPDVVVGPDALPAQCATGLYGVGPDAPPREAVGLFSCIWMMEEDVAATYERLVMNSTNLDCVGISEPKSLLCWCVDIWLAIAGRRIAARISQTAKKVMKEIIQGIPSEVARLDLANAWRTKVHDAVSISRHELPLRDTADDMMTSELKEAGIEEALWFFPRWEAQNVDSDTDLFLFATDTKTPIEPLRKKSGKDRKRFNKPVLSLMAGKSFVNVVAPIEFEDSPANNLGSSSSSYLGGSWSTGNLSSEGEGSQSSYVHVKLKGGPAPEVQKGFVKARIEEVDGQKAVMGNQVNSETLDKSCPSARWLLTNIIGFHWPVDRICFKMATQCSIAEITALTTPLMKQLEPMTQIEKETSDPGNSLKELLSFYLARRKLVYAAKAIELPYAKASKGRGASTWCTGRVGSSKPLVGRTGSSEEDYKHVCPNCLTPRSLIQAVCLMCSSKDKAVPRTVEDFVITVGTSSWKLDLSSGSPGGIFISSAPADEQVDINSSYQIPLGGLGHQPVSCSSSNMADGAMSYCDLDRERGRQRLMAEYTGDEEGVVFQEEKIDVQEAFGFHPVLVEAHGLMSTLCTPPENSERASRTPNPENLEELHANIEDMLKMFWDVKGSTSIGGRVLAAAKTDIESSKAVATRANEIDASLGFSSKGTYLHFDESIESGDLNPLGTASLLSHEEILSSTRSYVVACKCMSLNSFSGKLFQEVPALPGTASNQTQFEQPSPLGIIHFLLHSNKGQMRLSDAEWVLMPGPLDEDAASVSWQKYIGKDWGDYAEIESVTRGLGDTEGRGQMCWQNNFDQRQIEEEILSGKRRTALPNSPLVGIYRKDPASWQFERKIAYWDLPSLFHRRGGHDSKEELRWRAQFDERLTVPIEAFPFEVRKYFKNSLGRWAQVEQFYHCNTKLYWLENVEDAATVDEGATGPGIVSHAATQQDGGSKFEAKRPAFMMKENTKYRCDAKKWSADGKKQFWNEAECGLILSASSQWEMKVKSPDSKSGKTGWICRYCSGGWSGSREGSHFIQINDGSTCLQIILDSPDQTLHNNWTTERMEYFTRFEPKKPCRDVPPTLADAPENHRVRFSGVASNALPRTQSRRSCANHRVRFSGEILYTNPDLGTIVELDRLAAMSVTGRRDISTTFGIGTATCSRPSEPAFLAAARQAPTLSFKGRGLTLHKVWCRRITCPGKLGTNSFDSHPRQKDLKTRPPTTVTETTSSPSAIPVAYEADVALLHSDARRILDQYSIPYSLQAKLAVAGYVTVDDLSCRWNTPELARSNGEADLDFSPTHLGWDQRSVDHTCMRLFQAVRQAQAVQTAAADAPGSSGQRDGVVLQAGKRASLEENYKKVTGSRRPLQEQGSDAFLSAQFKLCEKGEIGFFHTKQMVSAMPDPLEMAATVKGLKPINGFLYQDQEERKSPYSKEQWESVLTVFQTNLLIMCVWAFPNNRLFDLEKSDMDAFYKFLLGDEIAKRSPAPELKVLMHAERAAWRKVALHMHEGLSLKTSLDKVMSNSLFWTREVYEKVESGPKGKGKDKGKAKAAWLAKNGKQEWYPNYEAVKEEGKGKGKGKAKAEAAAAARARSRTPTPGPAAAGGGKWPAEWAEANAKGQQFCKNFHLRSCAIKCGRSHNCPVYKTDGTVCNDGRHRPTKCATGPGAHRSQASDGAGPAKVQKVDYAVKPRLPSLADNSRVPPPVEKKAAKRKTAESSVPHFHRPLQTSLDEPAPWFPWLQHVPQRLRTRLRWECSHATSIPADAIVVLFAGKEDPTSLGSAIHAVAPELSNSVVAIDMCRGKGNDLLAGEPYASLCTAGKEGKLNHCGGGPMCRLGNPSCTSFLEHPADPAVHSKVPGAEFCSSCWITKAVMAWGKELCLKLLTFYQCRLGQIVPKTTGSLTDLCLDWDMSFCNHADKHIHSRVQSSEDLSRYPWGMMMDIARAIAAKRKSNYLLDSIFNVPEDEIIPCTSDRPKVAVAHAASSSSPQGATSPEGGNNEIIQTGFKRRPIRDGGGKPSPGRRAPPKRSLTALATVGTAIMKACPSAASDIMASLARQDRDTPFDPDMLATIRQLMCTGSWKIAKGQPFYFDLMTHTARKAFDIDSEFPLELRHGVPLGVDEETLCSPGLADALYGLRWLKTYGQVPWWVPTEHIPIAAGATGPETAWEEEDISDGKRFSYDEIAEGLGRLQWATNAFPLVKPFLQPFWAWKTAVVTASFPSRLLRMMAKVILLFINSVITSTSPFCPTSSTGGGTDAGADDTTATTSGWFSDLQNPRQVDVSWFFLQLTKDNAPWAFDKSSPQRRIAALEMFGTLLLFRHLAQEDKIGGHSVYIPLLTDNQGNALSILNHRTNKWPCSPILMELVLQAHVIHTPIAIRHVKRDFKIWADALTNNDFWGKRNRLGYL